MLRKLTAIVLIFIFMLMVGCATHIHKVGNGAQGNDIQQARQWYVLWGLVPINNVDTNALAGGATDYTITTQQSALDVIINIFTGYITVTSRTVKVQK